MEGAPGARGQLLILGGRVAFDGARRQVADHDGSVLHLTPKAFDLLAILIDQAPRVVPKAELHHRLWPGTFVTDAALASLIKELRRVLGDRDSVSPIIRTAHGFGYALAGSIDTPEASPAGHHWLVGTHRRYALRFGDNVIGRDPGADVWLDDTNVSRRHARIVIHAGSAVVEDLQSKNGTLVGEVRVERPTALRDGDIVRAGSTRLVYRWQSVEATTDPLAPYPAGEM